jgi:hypothetical protein
MSAITAAPVAARTDRSPPLIGRAADLKRI